MITITVHGRLAHQPELKIGARSTFCEFRLLSHRFAGGEEHTEAVTFFCFGELAERFCEATQTGQWITATGTQETQRWTPPGGAERLSVRYRLTWWEAGARPRRVRSAEAEAPSASDAGEARSDLPAAQAARDRATPRDGGQGAGERDQS